MDSIWIDYLLLIKLFPNYYFSDSVMGIFLEVADCGTTLTLQDRVWPLW